MTKNASKQSGKDRKPGPAAGKKKHGGAAKKLVDPSKSVLRLPTLTTLRKETDATAKEIANSDPKAARKYGKMKVKKLYAMVDENWHDGWEDQGNESIDYFEGFAKFGGPVISLSVRRGIAFERCHEVMRVLADSWENVKSVPARIDTADVFAEADWKSCPISVDGLAKPLKFFGPVNFFAELWPVILWAAASNKKIGDELLYRWIKDAHDYGVELPDGTGASDLVRGVDEVKDASGNVVREATPGLRTNKRADLKKGHKRIKKLYDNRSLWEDLRSRKVSYRRKRVVDRRFPDSEEESNGWCSEDWRSDDERHEAASNYDY